MKRAMGGIEALAILAITREEIDQFE